jgi:hypothetical protein
MQQNSKYFAVFWVLLACRQTGTLGALLNFSLPMRQETKESNTFEISLFSANYLTLQ